MNRVSLALFGLAGASIIGIGVLLVVPGIRFELIAAVVSYSGVALLAGSMNELRADADTRQ